MNRSESIETDRNPVLMARLQATMPETAGRPLEPSTGAPSGDLPLRSFRNGPPAPRLQQTVFASGGRPSVQPPKGPALRKPESWFVSALDAIRSHAWLILALALAATMAAYLYTVRGCVPLYRVQASLEVRNNQTTAHTEALAHVLQSQSLVNAALSALSPNEQSNLVEHSSWNILPLLDATETLHNRLEAEAIPSAEIIDISLLSPNPSTAVRFVNNLIDALAKRQQADRVALASVPSPNLKDWNSLPPQTVDDITVIDPATASLQPVSPNLANNLLFGMLLGALLGASIALFRKFAVTTFKGPGSVAQVLGVRELGAMPQRKLLGPAGSDTAHAGVQIDANDESLRYLRSSLLYHPGKQQTRFLAFTSAAPGEGKTTVVANLSMSLAATGRRVLVIDGDLRRPRLYKLLQVNAGPGLADLLRRRPSDPPALLSKFVTASSFQNLYVLPPGTVGADTPELLAGPHLEQLFQELAKSFDFVLIDTPPLLACSDARNYARAVEGVVLVVRSSETQKRAALVARDMLMQDGATIVGTVLTGWRQSYPSYNYPATVS